MQQDEIGISTVRYVYYDSQGEITSISNTISSTEDYISVELDKVINFLTGKENPGAYVVVYDTLIKQHVLKLKYHADETAFFVTDDIYKVPRLTETKPDLIISQDTKNKQWIFSIDNGLQKYLQLQSSHNRKIHFSITRNNDPHELYQLIMIDFEELIKTNSVKVAFKYQTEESTDNLSVYTTKRFETYIHEVIND